MTKKEGAFSMPKAERKFNFAKYSQINNEMVQKGLL